MVIADFLFTATAVVAQPVTGVLLVRLIGYSLLDGWIVFSILLYVFTGAFWLPVVWMQMRMRDLAGAAAREGVALPRVYHRLLWTWWLSRIWRSAGHLLADDRAPADHAVLK